MCRGKFFKKTEEIFPTLELLEGHGYIRLEEPERQSVGRPADVKIIMNPRSMKQEFSAFIAFPAQSCTLVSHHRGIAPPSPSKNPQDLEMDGSGESGGFSRTVGDRIAYRSKDAGHT